MHQRTRQDAIQAQLDQALSDSFLGVRLTSLEHWLCQWVQGLATKADLEELSSFLEAEPITENFQPVKLVELSMLLLSVMAQTQRIIALKLGNLIWMVMKELLRRLIYIRQRQNTIEMKKQNDQ